MDEVTRSLYDSLKRYYTHIFATGYESITTTQKLLIFMFIEELFEYELVPYITDKDLKLINLALTKLYGSSCVIKHPTSDCFTYINTSSLYPLTNTTRRAEDSDFLLSSTENYIRSTENG